MLMNLMLRRSLALAVKTGVVAFIIMAASDDQ